MSQFVLLLLFILLLLCCDSVISLSSGYCHYCFVAPQLRQQERKQRQHPIVLYNMKKDDESINNEVTTTGILYDNNIKNNINRRKFLSTTSFMIGGASTSGVALMPSSSGWALSDNNDYDSIDNMIDNNQLKTFQIIPDNSIKLNPILKPMKYNSFIQQIALLKNGGTVWLGEHHNSQVDHTIQLEIIKQIYTIRNNNKQPVAIGLEQVQIQFQNILNDYISDKISIKELRQYVQWDTRWGWSFDLYEPIFIMAKQYHISLIALNVNTEDLVLVQRYGYQGLPYNRLSEYIIDPPGFGSFIKRQQYKDYVNYVIQPSYELHQSIGLLKQTIDNVDTEMSYGNFFSARILWDESMASNAYKWRLNNPNGLLIGLVGADHVKFVNGIPGRYSRYDKKIRGDCISVMLNPTLIDTRPYGTVANTPISMSSQYPEQITLQLRYNKEDVDNKKMNDNNQDNVSSATTGGVLALADYIVIG